MPKSVRLDSPVPQLCKAVSWVDSALVMDVQRAVPGWCVKGTKVNDISPMWPLSEIRRALITHAKMFKEQMEGAHGVRLLTNESDIQVWGPFRHKTPDTGFREQLRKRADPVTEPRNVKRVPRVIGHRADEMHKPEFADFYFRAYFVADHGYVNEEPLVA